MNYGKIKNLDIANGIGIRVSLFVSGCTNHCRGCFQPETWDFDYGQRFTAETCRQILTLLEPSYIHGLSVLGGEPLEPSSQRALLPLFRKIKREYPDKSIWIFSGFLYESEIMKAGSHPHCEATEELLSLTDVLVDGRFAEEKRDVSLLFRGSSNQRIIDLSATRQRGCLTLWDEKQAVD
ncbi:MAG: anaerobic ribonucleoside-triphosphate reductase activating protein [Lachnospiraceae bacterium]|nr:anaerobic ribonucleoside-triphosphate reductase activating protein [Lachnospiraceae bacterium]